MQPHDPLEQTLLAQTLALESELTASNYDAVRALLDERENVLNRLEADDKGFSPEIRDSIARVEARILEQVETRRALVAAQLADSFRAAKGEREYRRVS